MLVRTSLNMICSWHEIWQKDAGLTVIQINPTSTLKPDAQALTDRPFTSLSLLGVQECGQRS